MESAFYGYISKNKKLLLYSVLCFCLSLLLTLLARSSTGFSQWYGERVSPIYVNTLGRLFSPIPFSVFELMICAAILGLSYIILKGLYLVLNTVSNPGCISMKHLKWRLASFFCRGLCVLASLLLIFTLTASINYSRPVIFSGTETSLREYSPGELLGLSLLLLDNIAELADAVPADPNGLLQLAEVDLASTAAAAMRNLEDRYPSLSGYYPSPKPVFLSKGMSYLGITGIFSPFTMEANYNRDVASYLIPYTICHELAHLKGFMREDEAGFLAYLACRGSESIQFQYSGTLNALLYTLNALYGNVDYSIYESVYFDIPERVRGEIVYSRSYWRSHTTAATTIAQTANNKYLMANAQTAGTKSYGMIVDLLLEEYSSRILAEYGDQIPEYLLDKGESAELN